MIKPFAGLRPAPGQAAEVAAPPYDVMSTAEARAMVAGRPWSFLHISRAEVDLAEGTDAYADAVYAKARENLDRMIAEAVLVRDPAPCYYRYRLTLGEHRQTGLVAVASVAAYDAGRIRKHELTRPAKESDRVRQIDALDAQTGPAFLVYPAAAELDALIADGADTLAPEVEITAADGVRHELWPITEPERISALTTAFAGLEALYVADGHHRSAAASRVAAARRSAAPDPDVAHEWFLSVIFPQDQVQILPYNRVVKDLNGLDADGFLARLAMNFRIETRRAPVHPSGPGTFGMYLGGQWYSLRLEPEQVPRDDPVRRLDVSLLQDHLIEPLLGIADPRRDERIDFVGGIRGLDALSARVDSGEMRVAFSLYPTRIDDLLAVADAGAVMPPKSTWFEPKLADGLVSHVLDG